MVSSSGVEGVMCSVDAGHWSNLIDGRVSSLDILVDLSFIVLNIQSSVIIKIDVNEPLATIFPCLSSKLLQERQL